VERLKNADQQEPNEAIRKKADSIDRRLARLAQFASDAREALARKDKLGFENAMLRLYVGAEEECTFLPNDGTPHGKAHSVADFAFQVVPAALADVPIEELTAFEHETMTADNPQTGERSVRKMRLHPCIYGASSPLQHEGP
jgi:hypothetical protein